MNYLSHFFVDKIDGNDAFNYGLLLPDFSRNYALKKLVFLPEKEYKTTMEKNLYLGSLQHIKSDKIFHNSEFFKTTLSQLNQAIFKALKQTKIPRQWFLGHILMELVLDRMIAKKHPNIINEFYTSLGNINTESVVQFLLNHGISETELYTKRMNYFFKTEYLKFYSDDEQISHLLNGIYRRSKLSENWADEDILSLANFIPKAEMIIQQNMPKFEQELNTKV